MSAGRRQRRSLWTVTRLMVVAELRAQRMLSRRPWVTILTVAVAGVVLAGLSLNVTSLLTSGAGLPLTNLAMLSAAGLFVSFANARITGASSGSTPAQTTAWIATWPLEPRRLQWLLAGAHAAKSVVLGGTLLLAVAVGAIRAATGIGAVLQIVAALFLVLVPGALLSMLPTREGDGRIVNMLFLIGLTAAVFAIVVPLPAPAEPWALVLAVAAVPAVALLGGLSLPTAVGALLAWAAVSLVLWLSVRRALAADPATVARTAGAVVSRAALRSGLPLAALVALRLRVVAIVATIAVVVAVTWAFTRSVLGLGIQTTLPGPALLVLVVAACSAGYLVLRPTLRTGAGEADWLRSLPLRPGRVSDIEAATSALVTTSIVVVAVLGLAASVVPLSGGWTTASALAAAFTLACVEGASRHRPSRGVLVLLAAGALTALIVLGAAALHPLVPAWVSVAAGSALGTVACGIVRSRARRAV